MSDKINFDDIRRQVDIVQVINTYVPLSRHGKGYVGVCPFHNDSNPSLQVSQDKQIYKCFSCGAAGNVFTFVQNYEKLSFIDAVRKVCDLSGLHIEGLEKAKVENKENKKETRLLKLLDDLTNYYSYQLQVSSGEEAIKYLAERDLNEEERKTFRIGYAPKDGHTIVKWLETKGYALDEVITSGVGVDIGHDDIVDRLRGRVIFPLADSYGRVVGFSGRRINNSDSEQKYVNTPETFLFHKSNVLYNYHNAANYAKKEGKTYIVEGFMDAIALTKAGIKSVVATMGTAFTSEHIRLLKALNVEICLFFDSDNPGLTATHRALEMLSSSRLKIKVVRPLTGGKDIDEILKNEGKESVVVSANTTMTPMEFEVFYLKKKYNLNNHEDAKKYVEQACKFLQKQGIDDYDREYYVEKISEDTGFSRELIKKQLVNKEDDYVFVPKEQTKTRKQKRNLNRYEQAEHQIIQMMLDDEVNIVKFDKIGIVLYSKICRDIAAIIIQKHYANNRKIELADLYTDMNQEMINCLEEILKESYPAATLKDLATIINDDYAKKKQEEELEKKILEVSDVKAQAKLALELINARKSKGIKEEKD